MKHLLIPKIALFSTVLLALVAFSCQISVDISTERSLKLYNTWEVSASWPGGFDDISLPIPSHISFDEEG
ncbi:MAG: hypothetical protein AAFR59_15730, partial [Bacteroidota bacterium]